MNQLEQELRVYRPVKGLSGLPSEFVWPRYEGRCVGNLAQTAAGLLGAELPGALPALDTDILDGLTDGVKRVVLLVMDAMGWLQLQRVMAQHDDLVFHSLADKGRLVPITTTFLSTTNSVLSTIWSGHPPLEHGLLGFELYLREWMMAVEAIGFSSVHELFSNTLLRWGFEPEEFLAVPSVGQVLGPQGVSTVSVIHKNFTTTPLSRMHFRGADEVRGHSYASDLWVTLRQALAALASCSGVAAEPNCVYAASSSFAASGAKLTNCASTIAGTACRQSTKTPTPTARPPPPRRRRQWVYPGVR